MSRPTVTVHVNRGETDALEAAVGTFETSEPFTLVLRGHEAPAHVHCRLDGDLERVATVPQPNYYVESDGVTEVPIDVDAVDGPVAGTLEVLTGYGAESVTIDVTVVPGRAGIDVDETLAKPNRPEPEPTPVDRVLEAFPTASALQPATLAVLGLGLVAIGVAAVTAATIGGSVATAGLAIVVVGFVVAIGLLLR